MKLKILALGLLAAAATPGLSFAQTPGQDSVDIVAGIQDVQAPLTMNVQNGGVIELGRIAIPRTPGTSCNYQAYQTTRAIDPIGNHNLGSFAFIRITGPVECQEAGLEASFLSSGSSSSISQFIPGGVPQPGDRDGSSFWTSVGGDCDGDINLTIGSASSSIPGVEFEVGAFELGSYAESQPSSGPPVQTSTRFGFGCLVGNSYSEEIGITSLTVSSETQPTNGSALFATVPITISY